ncbi:MAG: CarD family transcriptional regulator [Rhodospirillaceae bacterium]|nr:CarD family transcriptional regulator [Rhodospirillaceae bacterium]
MAAAKSKALAVKSKATAKNKSVKTNKASGKKLAAPVKKVATTAATLKPVASPKPKPASKKPKLQFKAGDYVVYPTHGVGLVQGIEKEVIEGHKLELVVVTFDNDRMTLRVPMEKMDTSGLRELSNRTTMDNAMTTLKGRARIKRTMWSRRAQEYEAKINSGDPISIAEVVRDLHRNVGQPDQSFSERQIYESALERLAGEVAAVNGTDKDKAVEKLEQVLQTSS